MYILSFELLAAIFCPLCWIFISFPFFFLLFPSLLLSYLPFLLFQKSFTIRFATVYFSLFCIQHTIIFLSVLCLASVSPSHWVVFLCVCMILYKYFYKIYFIICTLCVFLKKCTWSRCHKYILFILKFLSFDFLIKPFTSDLIIYLYNGKYFFRTIN